MDRSPSPSPSSSPASSLTTAAVVGLGTMGTGIAEVLARAGREVIGIDISEVATAQAVASLEARARARGAPREHSSPNSSGPDLLARFRTFTGPAGRPRPTRTS
ncbi:3-hydroxyacyl-CoA dehydrogenase NAD-binding domain-containing protein [Streptomyces sp. KL116D]|uniref:3-hydroxyacyl-CoA dehydrogenase NAD-binding domain-containing protein n=1 Tax=Streptomyces sp. KL116D TaxID=3045152 RepID=UPI0035582D6E